ncbi:MAG TPA: hypothetical protein VGT08_03705 [Terracidiphilus sp.]|nr:hypothetical protein [Terracidiphilus sp.]
MIEEEVEHGATAELTAEMIRAQLELLIRDDAFRSSKRSVAFLKYVVEQTLNGSAEQIKERTIGVEVFGRDPSYDTNLDHIVRTAATELRKRLASYYVDEKHRHELRMDLVPGSYIPKFSLPGQGTHSAGDPGTESESSFSPFQTHSAHNGLGPVLLPGMRSSEREAAHRRANWYRIIAFAAVMVIAALIGYRWLNGTSPQDLFWKPVLDTPGPVLLAVGDHPNGPPTPSQADANENAPTPILSSDSSQTVPFADAVTIARVVGVLEARKKTVVFRRGNTSSFSDLREGAVVLIGAFNNEWSLRLTRQLRYSLALDADKHLIYIRDAKNSSSRNWSWATNQPRDPVVGANSPKLQDFALISRIRDSETGHVVVVIGGLYTYGTQAAGEFLTDPDLMKAIANETKLSGAGKNLQIVLGTTVTDGTPGPPKVLAVSAE